MINDYKRWFKNRFSVSELKAIIAADVSLCGVNGELIAVRFVDSQIKVDYLTKDELMKRITA